MKHIVKARLIAVVLLIMTAAVVSGGDALSPNGQTVIDLGVPVFGTRYYNSAAGEMFPSMMGASITVQREFRRALPSIYSYSQTAHSQYADEDCEETVYGSAGAWPAASCPTSMCAPDSKWVMWDVPFSIRETKKRKDDYLGYKQSVSGFATGLSYMLGESSAVGLAVGYDYRKLDGRDNYHMRNRADTFHLALFGGTSVGNFFFDAYAGWSRSWNRSERAVYYTNTTDENRGNFNDTVLSAGLKMSYVWVLPNNMRITPSLGLDFSHVRFGGLTEKGSNTGGGASTSLLRVDKSKYSSAAMPIMISMNKTFSSGFLCLGGYESLWTPEVRGGYVPQFGAKRITTTNTITGSTYPSFSARSTSMNAGYGTVGAGLKIKIRDKYIFGVDYDFAFSSKYQNHSLTAMYGVSF